MTVKLECVYKHVVHDWKEMGILVAKGIALLVAITVALAIFVGAGYLLYEPGTALLVTFCQSFTSYNIFIALSTINILGFTLGAAYFWNKDSFITVTKAHCDSVGIIIPEKVETETTIDVMGWHLMCEAMVGMAYVMWTGVLCGVKPTDLQLPPLWMVALYIVAFIIGIPIACAIARCKE